MTDQRLYNWRSKYGGLKVSETKRLRVVEYEKRRMKTMVADVSLHEEALKSGDLKKCMVCRSVAGTTSSE